MRHIQNWEIHRERMQMRGREEWGLMGPEFPFEVMTMFWSRTMVMVAQCDEFTKSHRMLHFKII